MVFCYTAVTLLKLSHFYLRFSGVLWLCIIGEGLHITLLFIGVSLMAVDRSHCCNTMNRLKMNAFAALFTALSGNSSHFE